MIIDDSASPQEIDTLEQVEIPFLNDILLAAVGSDGEIYCPILPFCRHLGIVDTREQLRRIRDDESMREAAKVVLAYFSAKAKAQQSLTTTNVASLPAIEKPQVPSINASPEEWIIYHENMAALYRIVQTQGAILIDHQQRLDRHDDEIAALSEGFIGIREALTIIGETPEPRISIHQQNQLQALVSKIHDATGLHQATIFAAFKKQWRIPRYDELPADRFDKAYEWLRQWGRTRLRKE